MANQKETKQIQARKKRREAIMDYTFSRLEKTLGIVVIGILLFISCYIFFSSSTISKQHLKVHTIILANSPKLEKWTGKGATTYSYEFKSLEYDCKFVIDGHAYKALNQSDFIKDIKEGDTTIVSLLIKDSNQISGINNGEVHVLGLTKHGKQYISLEQLNNRLRNDWRLISLIFSIFALLMIPLANIITKKHWSKYNMIGITFAMLLAALGFLWYFTTTF